MQTQPKTNFKSFIITVFFPITCLIILQIMLCDFGKIAQAALLNTGPNYQFNVWIPLDNLNGGTSTNFFNLIHLTLSDAEIFLPIIVFAVCGKRSFAIYFKCTLVCYLLSYVIFLLVPVVNYKLYKGYDGPCSMDNKPPLFTYNYQNTGCLPSFECLIAFCPLASMCFIKLDQKKINKKVFIPFVIFLSIYALLMYLATIISVPYDYFADGLVSLLLIIIVFGLPAIIYKKKNGLHTLNSILRFDKYMNTNTNKQKTTKTIIYGLILFVVLVVSVYQVLLHEIISSGFGVYNELTI